MKSQGLALIAVAALTCVLTASAAACGTAGPGAARPSPTGRTGQEPGTNPATNPATNAVTGAACTAGQLDAALEGSSEPGTGGEALAVVYLWDKSAAACGLAGPVTVTGLSQAGRPVTTSVRFQLPPGPARLSPDGAGPGTGGRMPAGEVAASMLLIAAGADPSNPALACPGHRVDPAVWRVTLASGGSVSTPNESAVSGPALTSDGGLATCRGSLGSQSPLLIAS